MSVSLKSLPVFVACLAAVTASMAAAQDTNGAVTGFVVNSSGTERTLRRIN